jgi:predicted molibdopterin-dependent oxidoreductase YjgC
MPKLITGFERGRAMTFPDSTSDIFDEMKQLSKGAARNLDISGMSHDLIEAQRGIQWPMREGDDTGNPRLYSDGVFPTPNGKANLLAMDYIEDNEVPDDSYPFWLNSGRVIEHFHTRTKTGKIGNLNKFSPTPYMEMNPDSAREQGVKHQSYVRLVSKRGDAVVMVQLTQRVPHNMVFIPMHYHDCVNRLSLGLLDPYSRQPAFKQCAVRIEQIDQKEAGRLNVERRAY